MKVCVHHWIIEMANGLYSTGVCNKCREVRQFQNWVEDTYMDYLERIPASGMQEAFRPIDPTKRIVKKLRWPTY